MDVPYSYKERIIHFQVEWMGVPYSDKKKIIHFQVYHWSVSFRSDGSFQSSVVDACVHLEYQFSSVQSLSGVRLFATPWIAACQASLSITNSRSLLKPMSIE